MNKNDRQNDPVAFQNSILKNSISVENLSSVIALSMSGGDENERKQNSIRVAMLVSKFFQTKIDHCEYQTRKVLGGSRHWVSNNRRKEIIINLWDNKYEVAVANKLYTTEQSYRLISEDMEYDLTTSLYTVRTIVTAHIKHKRASV